MEELIKELEKKQSEIWVDIEDSDKTEDFAEGWYDAFNLAILIVKENKELFR